MIHVLLVDEQRLFSEAVRSLLITENDIDKVGIAQSGEEAMKYIHDEQPDVILMDMHVTGFDGIKAAVHIKDNYPHMKIIFLTSVAEKEFVVAAIIAGAEGFLLKDIDHASLIQSVRNAYNGQVVISGEAAAILARKIVEIKCSREDILQVKLSNRNISLSEREIDIASLLIDNISNKHIAKILHLSEGTVKNYISTIYSKLNVKSRKNAIDYLQGLIKV